MNKYISMLRGINVSGQKKIKMEDLRSLYESLGFKNVTSYIQSGNVIFDCSDTKVEELELQIEKGIEKKYGFFVPVQIRTHSELKEVLDNSPFDRKEADEDSKKHMVTFLSEIPDKTKVTGIQQFVLPQEKLILRGREAYFYCPDSYGKTKLSNNFLEKKLGVSATTRNWKTLHKLCELSA